MNNTQPLLFDIPVISDTGVWCQLAEGIDPAQWAGICRRIGHLSPDRFAKVMDFLDGTDRQPKESPFQSSPDSLFSRLKRVFCFNQAEATHLPLVCVGPDGLNS